MFAGALLLSSCAFNRTVSYTEAIETQNYMIDVAPLTATLDVEQNHVEGSFEWVGKKRKVVNLDELRDNAIFNALKKRNADVLVAPQFQYITEIRGSRKHIRAIAIGYPAKYVNFVSVPQPLPGELEVKELKADCNYVLINKDTNGAACGYQIVVPYDKDMKTIEIDEATIDKIILDGNQTKIGRAKKVKKAPQPAEQKNIIQQVVEKIQTKKENKKNKK